MKIQQQVSLKPFNTFGIDVAAKRYVSITSVAELKAVIQSEKDIFILSGGSNLLLTKAIDKLTVHINTKGIATEASGKNEVLVTVQAGENWHDFVLWCIAQNYGGLENLSLIPGNVGTSPIQNIGAYGVEVKDCITEVQAIEIATGNEVVFSNADCNFGYRNSIFKQQKKGKYIIVAVTFKLTTEQHRLNCSYGAIQEVLDAKGVTQPTIKAISDAVISIRNSKLPNPDEIGNSGSFFKNPVVSKSSFLKIQEKHPDMPFYEVSESEIKIPAGWLIEQSGFKGKRFGETGAHKNQALVLVNYGNATGEEIYSLAKKIQKTIKERFAIDLEIEVNVI